jgi:hypothetical protein
MLKCCSHSVQILFSYLVVRGVGHINLAVALCRAEKGGGLQIHDADDVNNAAMHFESLEVFFLPDTTFYSVFTSVSTNWNYRYAKTEMEQ